jgi:predicted MFS family arabinose efflux permease
VPARSRFLPDPVVTKLMVAAMVMMASSGVVFGLLAEIQRARHLATADLGTISGAYFAGSLVGLVTLAHLADRGHSRMLLTGSMGIASAALLWFAVADSLWELVTARAIGGLCLAVFSATSRATVARVNPARMGENLGRLASAEMGGFVLGPAVGAVLHEVGSVSTPFFVVGVAAAIMAAVFLRAMPEIAIDHPPTLRWWQSTGLDLLANRRVAGAALLAVALMLPVGIYDAMWSKYLSDLGASAMFVGTSLTLYGAPIVLFGRRGGQFVDRVGPRRAMPLAMLGIVPITALYGALSQYWAVAGIALVEAFFQTVAGPSANAAMAEACPPDRTAAGQGLSSVLGLSAAGILGGFAPRLYDEFGSAWLFGGVALATAVICAIGLQLDRATS